MGWEAVVLFMQKDGAGKRRVSKEVAWGGDRYRSLAISSHDQTLVGRGRVKLIDYGSMLVVEEVKVWPDSAAHACTNRGEA
jgi:hypothetical protein